MIDLTVQLDEYVRSNRMTDFKHIKKPEARKRHLHKLPILWLWFQHEDMYSSGGRGGSCLREYPKN